MTPDYFRPALVDGRTASRTSPARSSDCGGTPKAIASGRTNPRKTKDGQRVTPPPDREDMIISVWTGIACERDHSRTLYFVLHENL